MKLFQDGRATPLMLGRWRAKGAGKPLNPAAQLTVKGEATAEFRALWKAAFPTRDPLPQGQLHHSDGLITIAFHRVFR
jgi:hypothetical protein